MTASHVSKLIKRNLEGVAALASGVLIVLAWRMEASMEELSIVLYLLAFAIGGFYKAREGLRTLVQERDLDVNMLMLVAAVGAASIGYWMEGAILIFIFSLSGALESYTMERSRRDISRLMELKPESAVRYTDGQEQTVPIEQLVEGDIIVIKPGERIAADGIVTTGSSSVNEATITGESIPVDKEVGDSVFAGTMNGQGALFVTVTRSSESTLFSKIISLVQEAQSEKPASQRFMERFERIYARTILIVTAAIIVVPPWLLDWTWLDSLYKGMVFLVVASPCALVASIMPAMLSAIARSARQGVLFKGGAHLEHLADVKLVAFDKTGTLTQGRPAVTDLIGYGGYEEKEVLHAAASIESLSEHPLAKAIVRCAQERGIEPDRAQSLQAVTGWGVEAQWQGCLWRIGKPSLLDRNSLTEKQESAIHRLGQEGKTVIVIAREVTVIGIIALQDTIRAEATGTIAALRELGIKAAMLTGDQQRTADAIAREAGIDKVFAELLPEHKLQLIKQLKERYGHVAMVGDGVNDTPALATATVGIAMGGAGSDAALETADLVLMNDGIDKIAYAIRLSKRARRIIRQNMIFSAVVIAILIITNFTSGISLPLGVIGHEGSTLLVILNGLRLLKR
ncbi:heavy metal translocating P-type ATPase [Paenibacillus sp. J5C_2022]|uniref:heavy metal translocating P-type ATPase n=1 Tax=Paenibacillus sp. J5C2022 TaxID=2977129 RepID=UPI0021CDF9C5|nr:heavy metal translocating P-type ATPase [Paenibacillus sp. J5C2022]MCU6709018.1 heavy metal translocating P-type ATPase [Paenibacillus sp. J5C2022]